MQFRTTHSDPPKFQLPKGPCVSVSPFFFAPTISYLAALGGGSAAQGDYGQYAPSAITVGTMQPDLDAARLTHSEQHMAHAQQEPRRPRRGVKRYAG